MMPGMDGWTVLNSLKENSEIAKIPVIMMSMVNDRNLGYTLGASDYLFKPVNRQQLLSVLQKYSSNQSSNSVLIVEDDPDIREILRRQFEKEGWQVAIAANGCQAIERLANNLPSLIITDLMMPEMDGFELITQLRQHQQWRTIPVVIMTAKELTEAERQQLNGCVQQVFQKGCCDRQTLLSEIHNFLSQVVKPQNSSQESASIEKAQSY
jgi:CheY-like chemotaxis protein